MIRRNNKGKDIFYTLFFALASLPSCHFVSPDADEEVVFIQKSWFFGHGGVDIEPASIGLQGLLDIYA